MEAPIYSPGGKAIDLAALEPSVRQRERPPFSVKLCDPGRFFRLLATMLAPIRLAALLIWPAAILACFTAALDWYDLSAHVERVLYSLNFLQSLLIGMLTTNLFAKVTQGVVMSHHRADTDEFGIRLFLGFIPRFYIYRGPIKRLDFRAQRSCYAAPLLARLLLFAVGILMWSASRRSGSGAADMMLALGTVAFSGFLFTVNPLWPADGYSWLTAALKRPRLRPHAMRLLALVLRRQPVPSGLPRSEFLLLLGYALASIVFTAVLAYIVLSAAAFALEEQLRGTGVFIFCLLLAMIAIFLLSLRASKRTGHARQGTGPRAPVRAVRQADRRELDVLKSDVPKPDVPKPGRLEPDPPERDIAGRPTPQRVMAAGVRDQRRFGAVDSSVVRGESMGGNRSNAAGQAGPDDSGAAAAKQVDQEGSPEEVLSALLADEAIWTGPGDDPDWDLADPSDWDLAEPAAAPPPSRDLDDILRIDTDAPAKAKCRAAEITQEELDQVLRVAFEADPVEPLGAQDRQDAPHRPRRGEAEAALGAVPKPAETPAREDDLFGQSRGAPATDSAAVPADRPAGSSRAPDVAAAAGGIVPVARRLELTRPARTEVAQVPQPGNARQVAMPRRAPMQDLDRLLHVGSARPSTARKWRTRLIWLAVLAALIFVARLPYPFEVGGDFIIQPLERTQVRARTAGEITRINVSEGDWVEVGEALAVLSDWDIRRDIAVRVAEIAQLEAEFNTLQSGSTPEQVAVAEQGVATAELQVDVKRRDLERQEALFASDTIAAKVVDDARNAYHIALSNRDEAAANLALVKSDARGSEIEAARAGIERNQQDLAYSRLQLEHTNIRAPVDGRVASSLIEVPVGAFLPEGGLFTELEDNRTVIAEIEVPETEIEEVAIGATAELRPWSGPKDSLFGTVKSIAPRAEEREFGRVIRVQIEVPNPEGKLAANMTGFGKILAEERPTWRAFTRLIERFFVVELWSWLP